jgi:hypothetical protein
METSQHRRSGSDKTRNFDRLTPNPLRPIPANSGQIRVKKIFFFGLDNQCPSQSANLSTRMMKSKAQRPTVNSYGDLDRCQNTFPDSSVRCAQASTFCNAFKQPTTIRLPLRHEMGERAEGEVVLGEQGAKHVSPKHVRRSRFQKLTPNQSELCQIKPRRWDGGNIEPRTPNVKPQRKPQRICAVVPNRARS